MNNDLLNVIRIANREFQEFVEHASRDGSKVVESRGAIRRLEKVDLRLKQVGKYLDSASQSSTGGPEVAYQVMRYRENLKNLRSVIESLQFSLLAERARIEQTRASMQAARAWASSLREIS